MSATPLNQVEKYNTLLDLAEMGCLGGGKESDSKETKEKSKEIEKQLEKDKLTYRSTYRLLLLGLYIYTFITFLYDFSSMLYREK